MKTITQHSMRIAALSMLALAGCTSGGAMSWRTVEFADVEDVLGDTGPVLELVGTLPHSFLAGDGSAAEDLFAVRRTLAAAHPEVLFTSVLDVSALDEAGALAVSDAALDEALEFDGLVLLDHAGATAKSLRDSRPGVWLVRVNDALEVIAEVDLASGSENAEAEQAKALGIGATKK